MRHLDKFLLLFVLLIPGLAVAPGCSTLQQIAALRQVNFGLERVSDRKSVV